MLLDWFLNTGQIYIPLLTPLVFALLFRRLTTLDLWIYGALLSFTITDVVASFMSHLQILNHWVYNFMLFPQFLLVCTVFHKHGENDKLKRVFGAGCILIMVAHAMNLSFYQGMEHFANFTYIPASTWMAAYAFFFLRDKMITAEETPFNGLVDWFAIATLIDHAGAIPILSLLGWTNYINSEYSNHLFDLVTLLYMFWYLLILSGLLWTRTSLRSVFSSR